MRLEQASYSDETTVSLLNQANKKERKILTLTKLGIKRAGEGTGDMYRVEGSVCCAYLGLVRL